MIKLLSFLLLCIMLGSGCSAPTTPNHLLGVWQIDQFLVDGMDRTRKARLRYEPLKWGTGIQFLADGTFATNQNDKGMWKLSSTGELWLFPANNEDTVRWRTIVSDSFMILESRTKRVTLSRTGKLPELKKKAPNLITNLPGTWYFYRWHNHTDTLHYPSAQKQAVWLTFHRGGKYRSGEGKHESFEGKWLLEKNMLHLSELERSLKQSWEVQLIGDTLYVEPAADTTDWFKALLVRKI